MPNQSGNLETFAKVSHAFVYDSLGIAKTFLMNAAVNAQDTGRRGGTVDVRTGPRVEGTANVHTAADREARVEFDFAHVKNNIVPITLSDYVNKGIVIDYNEQTFLDDIRDQGIAAEAGALVAEAINERVLTMINAQVGSVAGSNKAITLAGDLEQDAKTIKRELARLRGELNRRKVSSVDRWIAVASDVAEIMIASEVFGNVANVGTDAVLRNATIGTYFGVQIVEEPGLLPGHIVSYGKEAFGLVTRPKALSGGLVLDGIFTDSASGLSLNASLDHDIRHGENLLLTGCFVGTGVLDPGKFASTVLTPAA